MPVIGKFCLLLLIFEFGPRSGYKLFDTLIVFLKDFSQKLNLEKLSIPQKVMKNYPACSELIFLVPFTLNVHNEMHDKEEQSLHVNAYTSNCKHQIPSSYLYASPYLRMWNYTPKFDSSSIFFKSASSNFATTASACSQELKVNSSSSTKSLINSMKSPRASCK